MSAAIPQPSVLSVTRILSVCRLVRLVALAMDLPPDYFEPYFGNPLIDLRFIHYTADVSDPEAGIFSCVPSHPLCPGNGKQGAQSGSAVLINIE